MTLDGVYQLTFRIYHQEAEGTPEWTETHNDVNINGGVFNVTLGFSTPLPDELFESDCWLSVEIGTDGEMAPRQMLAVTLYSIRSGTAESVVENGINAGMISEGAGINPRGHRGEQRRLSFDQRNPHQLCPAPNGANDNLKRSPLFRHFLMQSGY
jgi:hypothetical protein